MLDIILFTICMCLPIGMTIIFDICMSREMDKMRNQVADELTALNNRVDVLNALIYSRTVTSKSKAKTKK